MPVGYGQLGCSGFVISDKQGNFVSRKTRAYLQYDTRAFAHVEAILEMLLQEDENQEQNNEATKDATSSATTVAGSSSSSSSIKTAAAAEEPQNKAEEKKEEPRKGGSSSSSTQNKLTPPPSVGVDSMDHEHRICTAALNQAMQRPSVDTLEQLHEILKAHFDHEEELLEQYHNQSCSESSSQFSALTSHRKDHERILNIAKFELQRIQSCTTNTTASTSTSAAPVGAWHKLPVDLNVVHMIAEAFHVHAEHFDSLYDGVIPLDAH